VQTEFQNQNQYINYPFRENASLYDTGGGLRLWPKVIVDFVVYGVDPGRKYYLARTEWHAASKNLAMFFQDDLGNGYAQITVYVNPVPNKTSYHVYTFASSDDLVKGRVIVERSAAYQIWGGMAFDTTSYFAPAATEFEQGVLIPAESAVLSINQYGYTRMYKDAVKLKEGYNISLSQDENGITITAAQNAGLGPVCTDKQICYAAVDPLKNGSNTKLCGLDKALMSLAGAVADDNCEVFIQGNNCMRILKYPDKHMIVLHNECSEICDEKLLLAEIECRLCRLQVEQGLIPGPCDTECVDAPPEDQWQHIPQGI
jgi:hypothetical protein